MCRDKTHHHAAPLSLIAVMLVIVEVVGGWIANGFALLADAMVLFTDVGALCWGLSLQGWPDRLNADDSTAIPSRNLQSAGQRSLVVGIIGSFDL